MKPQHGHSADVEMRLIVDRQSLPVAQLGPGFLLLDSPIDHPPCDALVIVLVDGDDRMLHIRLPDGMSKDSKKVRIAAL